MRLRLHYGDLADASSLNQHRCASCSRTRSTTSARRATCASRFDMPEYTGDVTALGTLRLLEAIREVGARTTRFYQASSSEMFGKPTRRRRPRRRRSIRAARTRRPRSTRYWITRNYREAYGMFAANGILFNHESPRRGETFVTRKITRGGHADQGRAAGQALPRQPRRAARLGLRRRLRRGDVAHAAGRRAGRLRRRDRARATRCASSSTRRSATLGLDWRDHVEVDPRYFRPTEVDALCGDPAKAKARLGWAPRVRLRRARAHDGRRRPRARRGRAAGRDRTAPRLSGPRSVA